MTKFKEDFDLIKDLEEEPEKEETREDLIEEYDEIDSRIKHLRVMEKDAKEELRKALDFLNGIQDNIDRAEEELTINNTKLQDLNK